MYCYAFGATTVLTVLTIVTSMATFIRQKIVFNFQNNKNRNRLRKKYQANSKEEGGGREEEKSKKMEQIKFIK